MNWLVRSLMVVILLLSALIWRQMQPIDAMLHTRLIAEIAPYRQADPQIVLVNLDDSTQWSPAPIWHSPDQNLMATEILLEIAAANAIQIALREHLLTDAQHIVELQQPLSALRIIPPSEAQISPIEKAWQFAQVMHEAPTKAMAWQIDWRLPNQYTQYRYQQLIDWYQQGDMAAFSNAFADKYVIIGRALVSKDQAVNTVFENPQSAASVRATIFDNLRNNQFYSQVDERLLSLLTVFCVLLILLLVKWLSPVWQIGVTTFLVVLFTALGGLAGVYLAWQAHLLISFAASVASMCFALLALLLLNHWQLKKNALRQAKGELD